MTAMFRLRSVALLVIIFIVVCGEGAQAMHEFEGYRSRFFKLKRLELPDRTGTLTLSYVTPSTWRSELTDRDNLCIGDPEGDYSVQRTVGMRKTVGDEAAVRRAIVGDLLRDFNSRNVVTPPRRSTSGGDTFLEGVVRAPSGGEQYLVRSIFRIWPEDGWMNFLGFHILVREALWERPETEDIVELFRAQLLRMRLSAVPSILDRLPSPGADFRFGFRDLEMAEPYGFMAIPLPRHWREHPKDGIVGYYDRNQRSGTVWVAYTLILRDHGATLTASREVDRRWQKEDDPDLERLRWMVKDTTADRSMIVLVDLVLDKGQAELPEFQELILILDEQVRRMRIGVPPPEVEAIREIGKRRQVPQRSGGRPT